MKRTTVLLTLLALAILILPGAAMAQGSAQVVQCDTVYVIQAGDWLSKIADKYLGDVTAYDVIVTNANADSDDQYTNIENPDVIEPGWVICVPANAPEGLVRAVLANMEYKSEWTASGTAKLEDGTYSEEAAPGSATKTTITLTDYVAYGQLDGQPAAAAVLVTDPGGSGTFYDLAVVVLKDGTPVNVANISLGDRVQINSLAIENNQIVIDMVQAGPDDPMCCPSQHVAKTFELQGEELVETSSKEMTADQADGELVGPTWKWQQTLYNNDTKFVPDDPEMYTVTFKDDGTYSGKADCNNISGSYTVDGQSISIDPLMISTMAMCPPDSLENEFKKGLGEANSFFFSDGDLYIDLKFDSGTMKFSK